MTAAVVAGAVRGHDATPLSRVIWSSKLGRTELVPFRRGELGGAYVRNAEAHGPTRLAPLAASLNAMLAGLSFPFLGLRGPTGPGPSSYPKELIAVPSTGRFRCSSARYLQDLLSPRKRRAIRNQPIKAGQSQEAHDYPGGLPERQLEQYLNRQAELDCRIREIGGCPGPHGARAMALPCPARPAQTRACGARR